MSEVTVVPLEGTYLQWLYFRKMESNHKTLEEFMQNDAKMHLYEGYRFGYEGVGILFFEENNF